MRHECEQVGSFFSPVIACNCAKDEGRPLGADLQELASNHLKLLWSKAMVVSVVEKSRHKTVAGVNQGDERKQTTDEVSKQ